LILFYRYQSILKRLYCFLNNLSPQIALLFATRRFFRSLLLLKKLEGTLLGDITSLLELLESLEASSVFLLGNDATLSGLHQILLGQTTGSVLGSSVPDLGLGASSNHLTTGLDILASHVSRVGVRVHFYTKGKEIKTWTAWEPCLGRCRQLKNSFSWNRRLQQNERESHQVPKEAHSEDPSNTH
jgi:hypothetical protein